MSKRPVMQNRQESHRVFLQQYFNEEAAAGQGVGSSSLSSTARSKSAANDASIKTMSTAIRLTSVATAREVCLLLRQKFGFPPLPQSPNTDSRATVAAGTTHQERTIPNHINGNQKNFNNPTPLVHRIHAKLNQVRKSNNIKKKKGGMNKHNNNASNKEEEEEYEKRRKRIKRKQRRKRLLEIQSTEDVLVIVATCHLPKKYVKFEHEYDDTYYIPTASNSAANANITHYHTKSGESLTNQRIADLSYEPYNVIETLLPNEIPLQKQDEMKAFMDQLQKKVETQMFGETIVGVNNSTNAAINSGMTTGKGQGKGKLQPQIRWFFTPKHFHKNIPKATVVIDGYCTDADEDSDEDSDFEFEHDECLSHTSTVTSSERATSLCNSSPSMPDWRSEVKQYIPTSTTTTLNSTHRLTYDHLQQQSTNEMKYHQNRLHRERHRFTILSTFEAVNGNENSSGYLFKQSKRDKNIWKKVHCVLTENQFWFVSRVKKLGIQSHGTGKSTNRTTHSASRIGRHGIIDLNGSLFHEPSMQNDSPLIGIPNTFQLTTKDGKIHVFQAGTKNAFLRWSECISERILLCQENTSIIMTDLMISTETQTRQARCEQFLLKALYSSSSISSKDEISIRNNLSLSNFGGKDIMKYLVDLGMQIAEYKEQCKRTHLQYAFSLSTASRNMEDSKHKSKAQHSYHRHPRGQSEWLIQSYTSWNIAKSILKDCHRIILLLTKITNKENARDKNINMDIIEVQNEIKQRLQNFQQKQEQLHRGDDINPKINGNNEPSQQHFLLPEALFDQMFGLLISLAT